MKYFSVIFVILLSFVIYLTSCEKERKNIPIDSKYKNVLSEYDTIIFKNNFEQYRKYKVSKVENYFIDPLVDATGPTENEFYEYNNIVLKANDLSYIYISVFV